MYIDSGLCGIYIITNLINGKCYIGQAKDILDRWKVHKRKSTWKSHPNKALYAAFRKYGIQNFSFKIVELCEAKDLDRLEIHYIKVYDSYKNGYNRTLGGQGYQVDEETYFKNRLKKLYSLELKDIIEKMTPMYVTKEGSFEEYIPIYSKSGLNKIKKERKVYGETFDIFVDYELYDPDNSTHLYITLSSVNRYLLDNVRDLDTNFYMDKIFTESEYNHLYRELMDNVRENELMLNNRIEYDNVCEFVIYNNKTIPEDPIYDLIPDYDELGGDDYFQGCFF